MQQHMQLQSAQEQLGLEVSHCIGYCLSWKILLPQSLISPQRSNLPCFKHLSESRHRSPGKEMSHLSLKILV